jgi:uncharacterized membrane protein YidH (DUF202 family)
VSGEAGSQGERTTLAWQRTALSMGVVALFVTRSGLLARHGAVTLTGLVLIVGAAWTAYTARARHQVIEAAVDAGRAPVDRRAVLTLAALVALTSLAALWSVLP